MPLASSTKCTGNNLLRILYNEMSAHAQERVLLHNTIDLKLVLQREMILNCSGEIFFYIIYNF